MPAPQHIIESQQFSRDDLEELFRNASFMEKVCVNGNSNLLTNKTMATLFYEPSTRTRLSFEAAMSRLGGRIITTENAREFSSAVKGESLEDTIRIVGAYADVIVMRHYEEGASRRAAKVSTVPIINAGDGPGQHPTQALLDLYTIQHELGSIDGKTVALVGDLAHGRAVRSLAYLLAKFSIAKLYLVSPTAARMKNDIREYFKRHGVVYEETNDLSSIAGELDVIYQTRVQTERYADAASAKTVADARIVVDASILNQMKHKSIILHPLPRNDEISPEVDSDPRAAYFRQARNGLFVRMALLKMVLS